MPRPAHAVQRRCNLPRSESRGVGFSVGALFLCAEELGKLRNNYSLCGALPSSPGHLHPPFGHCVPGIVTTISPVRTSTQRSWFSVIHRSYVKGTTTRSRYAVWMSASGLAPFLFVERSPCQLPS